MVGVGRWTIRDQPLRQVGVAVVGSVLIPKPFSRGLLTWPSHAPAGEVTPATVQVALDRAAAMAERSGGCWVLWPQGLKPLPKPEQLWHG